MRSESPVPSMVPEKVAHNDDDEMSTVCSRRSSSSGQFSLPNSPSKVWPDTPNETAVVRPVTPKETAPSPPATLADLPSLGSLGHFAGQCSRCCFYPKGRCQNGYDCRFCHYEHDKRPRKKKTNDRYSVRDAPIVQEHHGYEQVPAAQIQDIHQQLGLVPALGFAPQIHAHPTWPVNSHLESCQVQATVPASVPATPVMQLQGQPEPVECWPVKRVVDWLASIDLGHLSKSFEEHRITGDILLELSPEDVEEIGIRAVGDKKRFVRAVSQLRGLPACPSSHIPPPPAMPAPQPGNWCQPPCWEAQAVQTPPRPPYPQQFGSSWPSAQNLGQVPISGPAPNFLQ